MRELCSEYTDPTGAQDYVVQGYDPDTATGAGLTSPGAQAGEMRSMAPRQCFSLVWTYFSVVSSLA